MQIGEERQCNLKYVPSGGFIPKVNPNHNQLHAQPNLLLKPLVKTNLDLQLKGKEGDSGEI